MKKIIHSLEEAELLQKQGTRLLETRGNPKVYVFEVEEPKVEVKKVVKSKRQYKRKK